MRGSNHTIHKKSPKRSKNLFSDIWYFLLEKSEYKTLIEFDSIEERDYYNLRVMQRIGIESNQYSVLNIHKIGIEAPAIQVFNELLEWDGDSICWPNHLAKVDRIENNLENIRILPFGWKKYPFKTMKSFFGLELIPLFLLDAIKIKKVPDPYDFDNARYLLYKCSGGYPIGIYTMYVRSSIPEMGELAQCQLISAVGFNFYGKEDWQKRRKLMNRIWVYVHNRVTANVLSRFKQLSEWKMDVIQNDN